MDWVKAGTLSLVRGFTYSSLDEMATHFLHQENKVYRDGFRHVLATTLSFIDSEYRTYTDGLQPSEYAEIRDRHIAAISLEVEQGEYKSHINNDKVEGFKKYFQPIAMAYVKFLYQGGSTFDRKRFDVQGAHGDNVTFYVDYGRERSNTVEPDIQLFMEGLTKPIMTLRFANDIVRETIEITTIKETVEHQLPLSVIHGQTVTANQYVIPQTQPSTLPISAVPLSNLVPLQPTVPYMTNLVSPRVYPQQPMNGPLQNSYIVPQPIAGYAPITEMPFTQPVYQVQNYPSHGVANIQGYPSNFVQQPQLQYPQQLSPQLSYSQSGLGYQTPIPQQAWSNQVSAYPSNNPFAPLAVVGQQTPSYQPTNYPLTGYAQPQFQQPTGY